MHLQLNPRRHDLVPLEDLQNNPSAALETWDAAEGVDELCIRDEEALDGGFLQGRGCLGEQTDDGGNFGD